jgi:hypothetical protein
MSEHKQQPEITNLQRLALVAGAAGAVVAGAVLNPYAASQLTSEQVPSPADTTAETPASPEYTPPTPEPFVAPTPVDVQPVVPTESITLTPPKPVTHHIKRTVDITPEIPSNVGDANSVTRELLPLHIETTIPEAAASNIELNAARSSDTGCSNYVIRGDDGAPIGIVTAAHCSLDKFGYREIIQDTDGEHYIITPTLPESLVGPTQAELTTVGKIAEYLTPGADTNRDVVIGVLDVEGATLKEVEAKVKEAWLSSADIANIQPGEVIYDGGWPVNQPNNTTGAPERQSIAMTVLGHDTPTVRGTGQVFNTITAAVIRNADGSFCTPGNSGSVAFKLVDGKPRLVGTSSTFVDFTGTIDGDPQAGAQKRIYYENKFGRDLSQADGVCNLSYELPDTADGAYVVHPITSKDNLPSLVYARSPEGQMDTARKEFFDPAYKRTVINGNVGVRDPKTDTIEWMSDPAVFYKPETNSIILARFDKTDPDYLKLEYVPESGNVLITAHTKAKPVPTLESSTGKLTLIKSTDSLTEGQFIDPNGIVIGHELATAPTPGAADLYYLTNVMNEGLALIQDISK